MEKIETEVKFYLTDMAGLRAHILQMGAKSTGRVFENNIRYDDKSNSLKQKSPATNWLPSDNPWVAASGPVYAWYSGRHISWVSVYSC